MKLKNVHYEYRGNDTWWIYFKDYSEEETFKNERTDGKKPACRALFTNGLGIRYYVEAKLTGRFGILRHCVKDPTTDYSSNDAWVKLVKKIEGADSDYIFDEIDLWYDATVHKCYFKIFCMNGSWTELFIKNMLNTQFGTVAQANGYYDTDLLHRQLGLCVKRSCCGIGFDPSTYKTNMERIMFSVKNLYREDADIVKASPWTNTFIGTTKEYEKEYSWNDFKKYMGLLHVNGSDIWDIEWEYDATCPMTGTEVADKLHLYLKPLAYKRLFEKEEREKDGQLLKNITDVASSMTKVLGCGTLYYYNLYFDDKSDLKNVPLNHINGSMLDAVKGKYYIRVVSYNKELPKNISSATLVWDQEENRYSVEDFTIKGYRNEGKKDRDEVQKEIDEMTKRIYEKLEIKFDTDTATREYCKREADIYKEMLDTEPLIFTNHKLMTLTEFNAFIKDSKDAQNKEANNKEEKNMGPKDTTFAEFCRKIYWGTITPVTPTKILIQGTATIIWWSDGDKTVVKCQKGDKMDPEKGIAMAVMKKFMGTNKTGSNYLDFAKKAIAEYEKQKQEAAKKRKQAADKKRRAQKKEADANKEA